MKKIWYEHVKRRPEIDKRTNQSARYSRQEMEIINSPSFEDWYVKNYPITN